MTLLLALVACAVALPVTAWAAENVSYRDEGGEEKVVSAEAVTPEMAMWGVDVEERWYVVQNNVTIGQRVTVKGDVHLILADGASLTVNGGINVTEDNALSIYGQENGTGKLVANADSEYNSAGIGGIYNESSGTIVIAGGTVDAQGGNGGAGIGGGSGADIGEYAPVGAVTITGGTVTAKGGDLGAGIGGGQFGSDGAITIAGGTVEAMGGACCAGIGGGYGGSGGAVAIKGGAVTATGGLAADSAGEGGAGIGSGYGGSLDSVTISGGTVTATGDYNAAGIGAGASGSVGTVAIAGGTVTATGGSGGSGIGAGSNGEGGTFSTGVDGHAVIVANSISDQSGRESWSGVIFENGVGKVYGTNVAPTEDFTVPKDGALEVPSGTTLSIGEGVTATVPEGAVVNNSGSIEGRGALEGDGTIYLLGNGSVVEGVTNNVKTVRATVGVAYVDENGKEMRTADGIYVSVIESDSTSWGADDDGEHWYVVQGEVNIDRRVIVTGKVHLILADGASLKVNGGINVAGNNSLSIYGQQGGSGTLIASAGSGSRSAGIGGGAGESGGSVTIAGGAVTATGGYNGSGIGGSEGGSCGTVAITGGTVTAEGGESASGIGSGCDGSGGIVTIDGGTVTATGGSGGAGIGGGDSGSVGTVTINGGTVTTKGGDLGAGIGGGAGGPGGDVTITGGTVTAMGDNNGAGIGGGEGGSGVGTFSTGEDGHAVIFASSGAGAAISDSDDKSDWSGVIFENGEGKVYGSDVTPTEDFTLPEGSKLEVPSGATLTIGEGVTATVPEGAVINNHGSIKGDGALGGEGTQYLRGDGNIADTVVCTLNTFRVLSSVEYVGMDGKPAKTAEDVEVLAVSSSMTAWGADDDVDHWYVAKGNVTINGRVIVSGKVHLILADGAKLTVDDGISVNEGNSLSIYGQENGTGKLVANGNFSNAGIGGSSSFNSGTIKIAGGTVTATGGEHGAGIGGGFNGAGGTVTITGGTVTATGGSRGAGIGGGNSYGQGNTVTITGGTVTATGGDDSAGIGGGSGGAGGAVDITGGTVVAMGGSLGAGIGGGSHGSGGTVTISGGSVTATGGSSGAGIGGGENGSGGTVTITDGAVTATGGDNSAGIGGGNFGSGSTVTISGGTVTTTGGYSGAGIGGGDSGLGGAVTISGGTVDATGGTYGAGIGGGYNGTGGSVSITGGIVTAKGGDLGAGIGAGSSSSDGGTFSAGEGGHAVIFASSVRGEAISDQSGKTSWSGVIFEGNSGEVYGSNVTPTEDFTIPADHALTVPEASGLTITKGVTLTNEGSVELAKGCAFTNNGTLVNDGTFTVNVGAKASGAGTIDDNKAITKAKPKATASVSDTTDTSFTVSANSEYETSDPLYAVVEGDTKPSDDDWQESGEFTCLEPSTQYTAYVRYTGTDYYEAAVGKETVWTAKAAPAKNVGFTVDYKAETVKAEEGYEIKDGDDWTTDAVEIEPGGTISVRAAATTGGAPASAGTENVLAESPTLTISDASASRNGDTVRVNVKTNEPDGAALEYKFSGMDWQKDNTATFADGSVDLVVTVRIAATDSSFASKTKGLHFGSIEFSTSSPTYKGTVLSVADLVTSASHGPYEVNPLQDLSFSYVPCNAGGSPTGESVSGTPTDAGTYLVTAAFAKREVDNSVYWPYAETAQVTIEPKELTIGVEDAQVAYGLPAPTIQDVTLTGMKWVGDDKEGEKAKELEAALRDGLSLSWVSDEGQYSTSAAAGSIFAARLEPKGSDDALANYSVTPDTKNLGTLTVAQSGSSSMTLAVKDEAGKDQTSFTYGEKVRVEATVAPAASNALARAAAQPDAADARLSCGDTVLAERADSVVRNQDGSYTFTFTYDTAGKQVPAGQQELTVFFAGDGNLPQASASASIALSPKQLTASVAAGEQKAYDGTAAFSDVALELDGALTSDDVSFTASGTAARVDAGEGLAFTATSVAASGKDASFYTLDPGDVKGTVDIARAGLEDSWFTVAGDGLTYTGDALTPAVSVADDAPGYLLDTAGGAWTVSYENNTNTGVAEAVVSGKGNFTGTVRLPFTIGRADVQVTVTAPSMQYTGDPFDEAKVTVSAHDAHGNASDGAVTLSWYAADGDGWTQLDAAPTEVGSYRVVASVAQGTNHNAGTGSAEFQIVKQGGVLIKLGTIDNKTYDGSPLANPQVLDLGGYDGGSDAVTFTWYDADGNELAGAPSDAGTYTVRASAPATSTQEAPAFDLGEQMVTIYQVTQSLAADQVSTTPETAAGASDGTISVSGLAEGAVWEWRAAGGDEWTAAEGAAVDGLAPGTYEVRLAGSVNYAASASVSATVQGFADTHGGITFPAGSMDTGDGTVALPEGGGTVTLPGGSSVTLPGGTVVDPGTGTATLPEQGGTVTLPGGSTVTVPGGSVVDLPSGTATAPDGTTVAPSGDGELGVTFPNGETVTVPSGSAVDGKGVVTTSDGSVVRPNGLGGIAVTLPDGTELTAPSGSTVSADGTVLDPSGNRVEPETPEKVDDDPEDDGPESNDAPKDDSAPGLAGTGDATAPVAGVVVAGLTALLAGLALRPRRR
ncbi:YDG domain-containing protein [Thermophilibacter sp.]